MMEQKVVLCSCSEMLSDKRLLWSYSFMCVFHTVFVEVEGEKDVEDSIPVFYYRQGAEFVYLSKCTFHFSVPHLYNSNQRVCVNLLQATFALVLNL